MPLGPLTVDGELVLIFGAIVAMESVKRMPAESVLLRRTLFGPWRADEPTTRSRLTLVAPFAPMTMAVALPTAAPASAPATSTLRERLDGTRRGVAVLRALGLIEIVLVVLAVPVGVSSFGAWGLLAGLGAALLVALLSASVARSAWRRIRGGRPPLRRLIAWCWPFSAPSAGLDVLAHALEGASALSGARLLLEPAAFAALTRPRAYDHLANGGTPDAELAALLSVDEMRAIVDGPSPGADAATLSRCRRCGAAFTLPAGQCPACDIPLSPLNETRGTRGP